MVNHISTYAKPFEHPVLGLTYWDWNLQPLKDEKGNVQYLILSLINVTPYKFDEERFQRDQRKELENLVEERTNELKNEIEERKKAEKELKEARNNLELNVKERTKEIKFQADLLKNVNDAILSADNNYFINSWNPAAERQYGWKANEAIGKNVFELLQVEYPGKEFSEARESIVKNGGYKGEEIHQHKDGTHIIVETTVMGLRDKNNDIRGWVAVIRDITERKKAEEELQRSRENFRTLAENSPDSIIRLDKDLRYVYVNSAAAKITGKSPEDFIGKTYGEVGIPEEYAKLWTENNLKAIETGKIHHYEFEFTATKV